MHPTPTVPDTGPVVPTGERVTQMRDFLLANAPRSREARHKFAEGWLSSAIENLSPHVTGAGVGILANALAVLAAVEQLDAEEDGFLTPGRDNPETGQALPKGVNGFSCGRYAR